MERVDRFFSFFRQIEGPLGIVLNANGCREGWLQGELYRYFRTPENRFAVNRRYEKSGPEHDVYCALPNEMVAEVKVYGLRGYYNKNLYGSSNLSRFIPPESGQRVPVSTAEINELLARPLAKTNSYLRDVLRLQAVPPRVERYLILVLQKAGSADDFGRAISAVQVAPQEFNLDCERFHVRISRL